MKKFAGKKLLVLGSNVCSDDIVCYARDNGAYTYVTDYLPAEKSFAKELCDEPLMVSTGDFEELCSVIEDKQIDAVLAGISEFNLLQAMRLSEKYGLPFYCTRQQWDSIESKDQFRELCNQHGVPCPQTFFHGDDFAMIQWETIRYPVVLKPVDASASTGVFFCSDEAALKEHLAQAQEASESKKIIIESLEKGDEFTAHYTICNGKATFSCIDNRYPVAVHEGHVTTIPVARIYPNINIDRYMEKVNPSMLSLCESLGMQNGVLFIQGLYDKDSDSFSVFEAGLRSAAEAPCRFIDRINGVNYMHVLVDHALLGCSDFDGAKEDCTLKGKVCGIVSFVAHGAVVGSIEGLEEAVAATPSVIGFESRYPVGSTTPDTDTLRQLMIRFVMICDSRKQMAEDIAYLNSHIDVRDTDGNEMVIKMDPQRVFGSR